MRSASLWKYLITNLQHRKILVQVCGKIKMVKQAMHGRWIVSDPDHLGGALRVRDTRISVALLLELLACGMTITEIVQEYPSLSEEAIRGVLEELAHSDLLVASR